MKSTPYIASSQKSPLEFKVGDRALLGFDSPCAHSFVTVWTAEVELHFFCTRCSHFQQVLDRAVLQATYQSVESVLGEYQQAKAQASSQARKREFEEAITTKKQQLAQIEKMLEEIYAVELATTVESSTCPSCESQTINLDEGCGVCGWLLGDIDSSPSKDETQSNISPSNKSPSKNRRQKGLGSGSIHWRTITRNGKDYPQAYYHWKEDGRKRTKYIPKQLFKVIQEAETQKLPVVEILKLLGVMENPSNPLLGDKETNPSNSEPPISPSNESPSKTRRCKGSGSGSIYWRTLTRNGKDYPQAYYHYEFWSSGDRLTKSTKYIPKKLLPEVQRLDDEKAPVREILKLLGVIKC